MSMTARPTRASADPKRDRCGGRRVRVISLRRNYGQTAAMTAGIDAARGEILIPMDADLQNDPADIARLLDKLDEGYDVVSGWRKNRQDKLISRKIPSQIANRIISWIGGVPLHDYGCSLKAYRREVIQDVRLYGEMHRFIPIYASWAGARVTEIPVDHHARTMGKSKYGISRTIKVIFDLMTIKFMASYQTKPIYVFGTFGMIAFFISIVAGIWAIVLKIALRHIIHPDAAAHNHRRNARDLGPVFPDGPARGTARSAPITNRRTRRYMRFVRRSDLIKAERGRLRPQGCVYAA